MIEAVTSSERIRLSSRIAVETADENGVVVYHSDRLSRLRLSPAMYALLQRFAAPAALEEVAPDAGPQLRDSLAALLEKGFLVRDDGTEADDRPAAERRLAPTGETLFRCPRRAAGARGDVAVIGVPYDLGTSTWAGARWAPREIRRRSQDHQFHVDFTTGKPIGWIDVQHRRRILAGVTFRDWGDVAFAYGEPPERVYRRIGDTVAEAADAGSFPLVIGGDHSVAYGVAEGLQRRRGLVVLYLDAHTDFKHIPEGMSHNHASTARRIVDLPNVAHMVQVGHRGYTLHDKVAHPWEGLRMLSLWDVRERGPASVLDVLPEDLDVHVSIDIDVIDPLHAPATSNLTPGGFTPDEVKAVLLAVGYGRRVVGLDFCGLNPERDQHFLSSAVACHLLLAGLGAALAPR